MPAIFRQINKDADESDKNISDLKHKNVINDTKQLFIAYF